MKEYFELDHAEVILTESIWKPHHDIYYMPNARSTEVEYHHEDPYCLRCISDNVNGNVIE